jgi:8-oxo-dGTP diphosphatase
VSSVFGQRLAGINYVDRPGAYALITNSRRELAVVETANGRFLPGGGLESGETEEIGLGRELLEEIGFVVHSAKFLFHASQYHWSDYYQQHFKKIGGFYLVSAGPSAGHSLQAGHALLWLSLADAETRLSQEFQRWAVQQARIQKVL